eukprot:jgi/Picre1/34522/NNA_001990.t1
MMMTKTRYSLAVTVLVLSLATSRGNPCSNEPLNYAGEFEGKLMNLKSLLTENSTVVFSPEVNWEIRLRPLLTGDATAIPRAYAGLKGNSGFGNLNESSVCLASPGNGALMDCSDDGEPSVLIGLLPELMRNVSWSKQWFGTWNSGERDAMSLNVLLLWHQVS